MENSNVVMMPDPTWDLPDRGRVGMNRHARRDAHGRPRHLGRRPFLQAQTHTLQIGQLLAAAIAGRDVPLECGALCRLDLAVQVRRQRFVAVGRVATKNVSHGV